MGLFHRIWTLTMVPGVAVRQQVWLPCHCSRDEYFIDLAAETDNWQREGLRDPPGLSAPALILL